MAVQFSTVDRRMFNVMFNTDSCRMNDPDARRRRNQCGILSSEANSYRINPTSSLDCGMLHSFRLFVGLVLRSTQEVMRTPLCVNFACEFCCRNFDAQREISLCNRRDGRLLYGLVHCMYGFQSSNFILFFVPTTLGLI